MTGSPTSPAPSAPTAGAGVPLCVDLDGTLIHTDLLHEALIEFVKTRPGEAWRLPGWIAQGRAVLKQELAARIAVDPALLPYRADLIDHLRAEQARGREIHLVSASPRPWVEAVARHLGC